MKTNKKTNKKDKSSKIDLKGVANFLFEVGILSKTPRSGLFFLGTGVQSVAEHTLRAVFIAYSLAKLAKVDVSKTIQMALFHDISEARISDLNYIHQKYVERHESKAIDDLVQTLPFGQDIFETLHAYEKRDTKEAMLVKDSDNLEWILTLKEQVDIGNERAMEWIEVAINRLKTEEGKNLAKEIMKTESTEWWFDKKSDWWVNRNKK